MILSYGQIMGYFAIFINIIISTVNCNVFIIFINLGIHILMDININNP